LAFLQGAPKVDDGDNDRVIVLSMRRPPLREWQQIIRRLHRIGCAEHARRLEESVLSLQKPRGSLLGGQSPPPVSFPRE
jgi:hypothetical protein